VLLEQRARVVAAGHLHRGVAQPEHAGPGEQEGGLALAEDQARDVNQLLEGLARLHVLAARPRLQAAAQDAAAHVDVHRRRVVVGQPQRGLEVLDEQVLRPRERRLAAGDGRLDKGAVQRAQLLGRGRQQGGAVLGLDGQDLVAGEEGGVAQPDQQVGQLDDRGRLAARLQLGGQVAARGGAQQRAHRLARRLQRLCRRGGQGHG
jgi:hypothetical protein